MNILCWQKTEFAIVFSVRAMNRGVKTIHVILLSGYETYSCRFRHCRTSLFLFLNNCFNLNELSICCLKKMILLLGVLQLIYLQSQHTDFLPRLCNFGCQAVTKLAHIPEFLSYYIQFLITELPDQFTALLSTMATVSMKLIVVLQVKGFSAQEPVWFCIVAYVNE